MNPNQGPIGPVRAGAVFHGGVVPKMLSNGVTDSTPSMEYKLTTWAKIYVWGRSPAGKTQTSPNLSVFKRTPSSQTVRKTVSIDRVDECLGLPARLTNTHALL